MYIMSIDQGTTGSTVILMNQQGDLISKHNQEFPQIFPKPGWVEHNPNDIWNSVLTSIEKVLEESHIQPQKISAIGITNQRETVVAWNRRTGQALHNAIVWQCRRTQDFCLTLKKNKKQKMIQDKTGLVIDPYFSGSKIRWLLKNVPAIKMAYRNKELCIGTIDSYLLFRLTNGQSFKTDVSNASRTMVMNIKTGQWDKDLLKLFSIPKDILPQISPSCGVFGKTDGLELIPNGIPIAGIAGDQQAALFGQAAFSAGEAKCTYGTGSFLLMNTGNKMAKSKSNLLTTIAWQLQDGKIIYALEGGAFICGAAVQWLRDGLGFIKVSGEVEQLAKSVSSSEGVEFVPALTGLGAPYWKAEARGVICGLTRGSTKAHIARATLEAMALQNTEILMSMEKDLGKKLKSLKVDGGASQNNLLMQLQSDYMGTNVERPQLIETTAIGAGFLAGLGVGFWKDLNELKKIWKLDKKFTSNLNKKAKEQRLKSWQLAVKKSF